MEKELVVYQTENGSIALRWDLKDDTIWANLDQISEIFGRDKSVISRHLSNIFSTGELDRNWVVAKNATTASDGKVYQVEFYNLDAILSVGYRVNSKTATKFRKWATTTLREHITQGYTINPSWNISRTSIRNENLFRRQPVPKWNKLDRVVWLRNWKGWVWEVVFFRSRIFFFVILYKI